MLDWLRLWPELLRLNLVKSRPPRAPSARGGGVAPPARCQCPSDSGRAMETRCEACLRFVRPARYRHVCPDARLTADGVVCSLDATAVRPRWGHALPRLLLPPAFLWFASTLVVWLALRSGGLESLPPSAVAWPPAWSEIAVHRRAAHIAAAEAALAADQDARARDALFAAFNTRAGDARSDYALGRLAAAAGRDALADELHAATLARHPGEADALALAKHDDLLRAQRAEPLARLALRQLARPDTDRDFWQHAFFAAIRTPGVARSLLDAAPPVELPHPALRHALAARAALDASNRAEVGNQLFLLRGLLPGDPVRRFLAFSWLDISDQARARLSALDPGQAGDANETALLSYHLLYRAGDFAAARAALRPLLADATARPRLLAALVLAPDPELITALATTTATTSSATDKNACWLAARLAGLDDLARDLDVTVAPDLAGLTYRPLPPPAAPLLARQLPLPREVLFALLALRP